MQLPFTTFPSTRLRRPRMQAWSRSLTQETVVLPQHLILPIFVQEGDKKETLVSSLPGVSRLSIDRMVEQARHAHSLGIPAVALFPVTPQERKTPEGEEALNPDNLICRAIRALKHAVPDMGIIADVALDPYTSHGHDGVLNGAGQIDNDATLDMLCQQALNQARAGCDVLAPSDMMDGRIAAIRAIMEMEGFRDVLLLSYSAKYASSFYGPFREAVGSAQSLGNADKRSYQLDPANAMEALQEAAMDISEGADWLMVKPAMPYLDIVHRLSSAFPAPVFAYQVSGEYAMLMQSAHPQAALMEALICIRRAGARAIITYGAIMAAEQHSA